MFNHETSASGIAGHMEPGIGLTQAPPHQPVAVGGTDIRLRMGGACRTNHQVTRSQHTSLVLKAEPAPTLQQQTKFSVPVGVVLTVKHRRKFHVRPPFSGAMAAPRSQHPPRFKPGQGRNQLATDKMCQ